MTSAARPPLPLPHPDAARGMVLLICAMLLVPGLDVFAKLLMDTLPPAQVGFLRFAVQSLLLLVPLIMARDFARPAPVQLLAGGFVGLALFSINMALREMPVANAIAIFFVEPLFLTLLAAFILREGIGLRRVLAVAAGLLGAIIVLRPNMSAYGWTALWPMAAAFFYACYMLCTRSAARKGRSIALQFWSGLAASVVLGIGMMLVPLLGIGDAPQMPEGAAWGLIAGLGLLSAVAHQMVARGLASVEAGAAAPFQYIEIISAVALGWLVFGDFPDALTWVGTGIIVASGIYVFHRERQLARKPRPMPAP